jgi:threonine dehydrogenase-like Zn-dependent dehydrogenase
MRLAGANVIATDVVPPDHPKAGLAGYMEAQYLNTESLSARQLMDNPIFAGQRLDVIFEASGASPIAGELIMYMSRSSIYVMTGIPREDMVLNIDTAQIWRQMVRYNQVLVGSVNSNRRHFEAAMADMPAIAEKYPDLLKGIITHRYPLREYERAFEPKGPEHIKTVIEVSA